MLLSPQILFLIMAKITNMVGLAKGKTGSIVYSVRGGEQIARAYNPYVANPNTPSQVQARSKLKLLSQVSAAVAPVIAIPKKGAVSARNIFTKVNYKYTNYIGHTAQLKLADMQLTDSAVGIEGFVADRSSGDTIHVALKGNMSAIYDAVVYIVIGRMTSGQLYPFADAVVENAGADGTFPAELPYNDGDISVHCYGIKSKNANAKAAYNNLGSPSAQGIAQLVASRSVKAEDLGLSETRGVFMAAGVQQQETTGVILKRVAITIVDASGNPMPGAGTTSGTGNYPEGSDATLQFTPQGYTIFLGWKIGTDPTLIAQNPYTIAVDSDLDIKAVIRIPTDLHNAQALFTTNSNTTSAALSGGGQYEPGSMVTFNAPTVGNNNFAGWYSDQAGQNRVSSNASYEFEMPNNDYTLYAKYEADDGYN